MNYAPFGKDGKTWKSRKAYQAEFDKFRSRIRQMNSRISEAEIDKRWLSRPEHLGPDGYATLLARRTAEHEIVRKRPPAKRKKGPFAICRLRARA